MQRSFSDADTPQALEHIGERLLDLLNTEENRLTGGGAHPPARQPVFDGETDILCKLVRTVGDVLVNLAA